MKRSPHHGILRAELAAPRAAMPLWVTLAAFGLLVLLGPVGVARGEDAPADLQTLRSLESAFQGVLDKVSPSVVGIRALRYSAAGNGLVAVNGSGAIIRSDGAILTNEHVIQSAAQIDVRLSDSRVAPATVLCADPRSDLAILKMEASNLPTVKFCDWSAVRRGQWIVALGNPYGLGSDGRLSLSVGVISNLGRRLPGFGEVDDRLYDNMIQTTAAIHPGNSGGPLFNLDGEVVGIVTAMHTRAAGDEGVGFAISLTPAKRQVVERMLRGERIEHAYLGVWTEFEADAGITVVRRIEPEGPAARADVRAGDVVLTINGQTLREPGDFAELCALLLPGQPATLEVQREKERRTLILVAEPRPSRQVEWLRSGAVVWRGARLAEASPEVRKGMQVDNAPPSSLILIDILPESPAARAGLRVGDVLLRINDEPVTGIAGFRQITRAITGAARLHTQRRGEVVLAP